jgi:hypothetical protein
MNAPEAIQPLLRVPGIRLLFTYLPSHLHTHGGYPASALVPGIRLLFTAYLFICTCVEAIHPLSWLQVELFSRLLLSTCTRGYPAFTVVPV